MNFELFTNPFPPTEWKQLKWRSFLINRWPVPNNDAHCRIWESFHVEYQVLRTYLVHYWGFADQSALCTIHNDYNIVYDNNVFSPFAKTDSYCIANNETESTINVFHMKPWPKFRGQCGYFLIGSFNLIRMWQWKEPICPQMEVTQLFLTELFIQKFNTWRDNFCCIFLLITSNYCQIWRSN